MVMWFLVSTFHFHSNYSEQIKISKSLSQNLNFQITLRNHIYMPQIYWVPTLGQIPCLRLEYRNKWYSLLGEIYKLINDYPGFLFMTFMLFILVYEEVLGDSWNPKIMYKSLCICGYVWYCRCSWISSNSWKVDNVDKVSN